MTVRDPAQTAAHPLQRLGADEIRLAKSLLVEHGLVGERTRFAYLGLEEPPKDEVLAWRDGDPVDRRVRAILLDTRTGAAADVVASLTRGAVDSSVELPAEWAQFAKQPTDPWQVDPAEVSEHRDEWLRDWSDITSR